jgi:GNAT superfamily N-acetyltransferase
MKQNKYIIRKFNSDDYQGIVDISISIFPDIPVAKEDYIEIDKLRIPKCKFHRWVVQSDDHLVGTGYYTQYLNKYHKHRFDLWIIVKPEFQHIGVGTKLYNKILNGIKEFDPRLLRTQVRTDRPDGLRMLEKRGFTEYIRFGESHLDVASFDPSPYDNVEDKLQNKGIVIKTLRELESDPLRNRKLYNLDWEVTRDEPGSADDTQIDFDSFVRDGINSSDRLPDGYFVAVRGDEYIGLCMLNANKADKSLFHGITGVKREYRRLGIALAMKVRAILYARKYNHPIIKTGNEITNHPMLAINKRLGFKPQPLWIGMEKKMVLK